MSRYIFGTKVDGLNELVRDLLALGLDVEDLKDAFADIARDGAQRASAAAPRRTGRLAGDVRGNRARSKAVVTVGRSSVPYAAPINYGWPARNIRPALFLQRADPGWAPYALRRLEQEINRKIRQKGLA